MKIILIAFVVMLVVIVAMAVGVMMGRKPIGGSCGGMSAVGVKGGCACGRSSPGSCSTGAVASPQQENVGFYDPNKN